MEPESIIESDKDVGKPSTPVPVELLLEVFWVATETTVQCCDMGMAPLVQISSVCHYWREICLSDPRLWANIDVSSNVNLVKIFLDRCKGTPIHLYSATPIISEIAITKLLSCHLSQIRSLTLTNLGIAQDLVQSMADTQSYLPNLQSIRLCNRSNRIIQWVPDVTICQYNYVHTLHLEQVHIPLDLPVFRNMVYLSLELTRTLPRPPTMASFIRILESSPQLQLLNLAYAGPTLSPGATDIPPPSKIISLPNLHQLSLKNTPRNIAFLVSHLSISAPTRVTLKCETEDFPECVSTIFSNACTLANYTSTAKRFHMEARRTESITIYIDYLELIIQIPWPANAEEENFYWHPRLSGILPRLLNLFAISSSSLEEVLFSLAGSSTNTISRWFDSLSHPIFRTIKTFGLEKSNGDPTQVTNCLAALQAICASSTLFSSLDRLILPRIRPSDVSHVVDFLTRSQAKLNQLEIRDFRRDFHETLVDRVGSVVWDPPNDIGETDAGN